MTNLPAGIESITAQEGRQIYIRFTALAVNGVAYRGSISLQDYGAGLAPRRDDNGHDHYALFMRRADGRIADDPTPAARKAAPKLLAAIGREWLAANPGAFDAADEDARLSDIARLDGEIAAMEAEIKAKRAARAALVQKGAK